MEENVKFNDFILNFNSGELTTFSNKKDDVIRLSPQSTKLLQLLIKNHPKIVSKDEMKNHLWSDVEVDFDNSLHFCIRQIRIALKDNVSNPVYIETIPRRGYRWLVEVQTTKKKNNSRKIKSFVVFLLTIIVSLSLVHYLINNRKVTEVTAIEGQEDIRLIIMPLQPTDSLNLFHGNMIAYNLLELFGNANGLEVIGPTTTINVKHENVYDFLEDSDATYLVNGKFSGIEDESTLLIEIIRNSDKAHIWVTSYNIDSSFDQITKEISNRLTEILKEIK